MSLLPKSRIARFLRKILLDFNNQTKKEFENANDKMQKLILRKLKTLHDTVEFHNENTEKLSSNLDKKIDFRVKNQAEFLTLAHDIKELHKIYTSEEFIIKVVDEINRRQLKK